jgi:predicted dithiol-disulfide oxidoreductase (DUF899 family)
MKYPNGIEAMNGYRREIADIRRKMRATQAEIEPQEVADYEFQTLEGPAKLSGLFGKHSDLIVVHNMGSSCPNCTLWADGYNGLHQHVVTRTGFVVSSPDPPARQRQFAESRGWMFPMVSHMGSTFAEDMGYRSPKGGWLPGVSVFRRDGNRIVRVSDVSWSPGDDFCTLWHFFDLLPGGAAGWKARFSYT